MASMTVHILRCGTVHLPRRGGPFAGRETLPVWCYLIEHPIQGLFLVDTGLGEDPLPPALRRYYRPEPGMPIARQLAARGVRPGELSAVLLSDLDPDHTGGLRSLRGAKRFLVSEEEYYWTARDTFSRRQPRSLWDCGIPLEAYYLRGSPIGPAQHALDLFGDESVISVLSHGHTFGNCTTVLQWNGKKLYLTGNAVRCGQALTDDFVYHRYQQDKTVRWLREMAAESACVAVLATHDPDERERTITL